MPNTVVDIHSHAGMSAFFSSTDNRDEQGLRLYMVVGRLDTLAPEREMRVGVYGYFSPVDLGDIFA
ncbi:MAG: Mov34/MPN/PAD-1 family protein, partial [Chloroflexi bacterium]|nr:Mov34/MPN/PAD-1 family protein [Chloroflexota bacterium]